MGFKPRTSKPALSDSTKEGIEVYADGLRELLTIHKVPKREWKKIWVDLEAYPDADTDLDVQYFVGWFSGVAEALGVDIDDLVKL